MRFSVALACSSLLTATLAFPQPQAGVVHMKLARETSSKLARRAKSGAVQVTLDNDGNLYAANISLGTPGQNFIVQIDTGSSDLWVPWVNNPICSSSAGPCSQGSFDQKHSSTFVDVEQGGFHIVYQDGTVADGDYVQDTLVIGGATVNNFIFALATNASETLPVFGIGYAGREANVQSGGGKAYYNLPYALVDAGLVNTVAYSLWLDDLGATTGNLLFGGIDTTKFIPPLISIDVYIEGTSNVPTSFLVAAVSLSVTTSAGTDTFQTDIFGAILDSGTTLTVLPDALFKQVLAEFGNLAQWDKTTETFLVPCEVANIQGYLSFGFGGPDGPVIDVKISEFVLSHGGGASCTLGLDFASHQGLDVKNPVVFGDTFLRSAYVVYDLANNKIAIANAQFNVQSSNIVAFSSLSAPIPSATAAARTAKVSQTQTAGFRTNSAASVSPPTPTANASGRLGSAFSSAVTQKATGSATGSAGPRNGGEKVATWTVGTAVGVIGIWGLMFAGGMFTIYL